MIELKNVSKYYGNFLAVNNLSMSIAQGEITGLLGPNGAGKTTSMRMITGFLNPSSGTITVEGIDVTKDPVAVKKKIGYLPESAPLYMDMLVYDYLIYVARIHGIQKITRIHETADFCGLTHVLHKNIGELSKGFRQRVGLAHAMIHDPEILILDEPTTGLDPNQILEVRHLIKEISKTKTVVISTHILQEVEAISDRVIIINQGELVEDNRTSQLKLAHGNKYTLNIKLAGCQFAELEKAFHKHEGFLGLEKGIDEEGLVSAILTTTVDKDFRPLVFEAATKHSWVLYEMAREQHSLENIFRDLTMGGQHDQK